MVGSRDGRVLLRAAAQGAVDASATWLCRCQPYCSNRERKASSTRQDSKLPLENGSPEIQYPVVTRPSLDTNQGGQYGHGVRLGAEQQSRLGEEARGEYVREMFARIVPRYDLFNTVSTFGQDRRWRALAVQQTAIRPGGGTAARAWGREPGRSPSPSPKSAPRSQIVGLDICAPMIEKAPTKGVASGRHAAHLRRRGRPRPALSRCLIRRGNQCLHHSQHGRRSAGLCRSLPRPKARWSSRVPSS